MHFVYCLGIMGPVIFGFNKRLIPLSEISGGLCNAMNEMFGQNVDVR